MLGGIVHVLVADGLVDYLADALGARLGGERGAAATLEGCNLAGERLPETVHADAREAHVHRIEERVVDDAVGECLHRLVVGGRKAQKPEFAFAGGADARLRDVQYIVRVEFAAWAVPDARLAKTAALRTAAHDFHAEAVVYQLHVGD